MPAIDPLPTQRLPLAGLQTCVSPASRLSSTPPFPSPSLPPRHLQRTPYDLELFVADSPLGPWRPHPLSPVQRRGRATGARMAGRLARHGGRLHRFGQDCGETYGHRVRLGPGLGSAEQAHALRAPPPCAPANCTVCPGCVPCVGQPCTALLVMPAARTPVFLGEAGISSLRQPAICPADSLPNAPPTRRPIILPARLP